MKNRNTHPIVIAHRGARHACPENTLSAFAQAMADGADGIELDVMLTSDKIPVVTHNDNLKILFKKNGRVHKTTFAVLKNICVDTPIPTLTQVFELTAPKKIFTVVEIKSQPRLKAAVAELVGGIITDLKLENSVIVSSFSIKIIRELKKRFPNIRRALIIAKAFSFLCAPIFARLLELHSVHVRHELLTLRCVEKLHGRGVQVFGWTANTRDEIGHLITCGVDGIITDNVPRTFEYLLNLR